MSRRRLVECVRALLKALPRCVDCGRPATRIGDDGDMHDSWCLCDDCRPELELWEFQTSGQERIDGMTETEVRWAPSLRELEELLKSAHDSERG